MPFSTLTCKHVRLRGGVQTHTTAYDNDHLVDELLKEECGDIVKKDLEACHDRVHMY